MNQTPGAFIQAKNLRPLAALKYLEKNNLQSIIYPIRKDKRTDTVNGRQVERRGELFENPINHDGGTPKCTIQLSEWPTSSICPICKKKVPENDWYFDMTLNFIINQYRYVPNKRDIVQCVKFYNDGEHEILYTEFAEANDTDLYIENDPIIKSLLEAQQQILQKAQQHDNVILEQNPAMIDQLTKLIDDALQQA